MTPRATIRDTWSDRAHAQWCHDKGRPCGGLRQDAWGCPLCQEEQALLLADLDLARQSGGAELMAAF